VVTFNTTRRDPPVGEGGFHGRRVSTGILGSSSARDQLLLHRKKTPCKEKGGISRPPRKSRSVNV